jgi:hypothetical protein
MTVTSAVDARTFTSSALRAILASLAQPSFTCERHDLDDPDHATLHLDA